MASIGQWLRLGRNRTEENPLLQAVRNGGLGTLAGAGGIQEGLSARPNGLQDALSASTMDELGHIGGSQHQTQAGSLADDRPENAVRLGSGMTMGGLGRSPSQYGRYVRRGRGGQLLEGHDYGNGDVRWFARKNPAVLQAAAAQAAEQQLGGTPPAAPAGLSARDAELLKYLLGNPTLRR